MFNVINKMEIGKETEALIIGLYANRKGLTGVLKEMDEKLNGKITELIKEGDISSSYKAVSKIHTFGKIEPKRLYFIGLGKEKEINSVKLKEALGSFFQTLMGDNRKNVAILFDSLLGTQIDKITAAFNIGEAFPLATYHFHDYKTLVNKTEKEIQAITVISNESQNVISRELIKGCVYGQGTNTARTLVNKPGNMLTAIDLADVAVSLAEKYEMEYEVLNKQEMESLGMGALLAVNQGSIEPPKMIVLKYQGEDQWENVLGLVGKGITFDTGGYSIKSKDGLMGMKTDMGGAAAVLGAMQIIGELKPTQNVVAVIPATDNMISGSAFKPDDVIVSMNGKTIEVRNTDAEGRLALADAVTYAKHHGANYLVDVATLTGGVIIALDDCITGAMTNNQDFYEKVHYVSVQTNEPIWQLPYHDVYKQKVRDSKIADLNNSPGREAHAIMAGAFIGEFAEDTPWVHLDIAGTATTKAKHDLGPSGATGVMARTLAALAEQLAKGI